MTSPLEDMHTAELSRVLTAVAAITFSLPVALFVTGSVALYAGVAISPLLFVLAVVMTLIYGLVAFASLESHREKRVFLKTLSATVSAVFIFMVINYWLLDFSYDGQNYHLRAIILLRDGWNPAAELMRTPSVDDQRIVHFPKATWIVAAILSTVTGSIETGKASNLLLLIVGLLLALAAVSEAKPPMTRQKFLLATLLALNPIHLKQVFTNYVDGQVTFVIMGLICIVLILRHRRDFLTLSLCCMLIIYGANVKFTAVIFSALILGPYFAISIVRRVQDLKTGGLIAIALVLGVGVFGYHPYVQNTVAHGKPFYPLGAVNIESSSSIAVPSNLAGQNRIVKLFYGVFGEAERFYGVPAKLKIPLTIRLTELKDQASYSPRVGGFGPFFNVQILIAMAWLLLIGRWRKYADYDLLVLTALVCVSVVAFPEPWYTRYIPQLWLVPLLLFIGSLGLSVARPQRLFGALLIFFAATNVLISAGGSISAAVLKNYDLRNELAILATGNGPIEIRSYLAPAVLHERLNARGIAHRFVEKLNCPEPIALRISKGYACFASP